MGIGNFALVESGLGLGVIELEAGDGLLLEDQTASEPIVIIVQNEDIAADTIDEETTGLWDGELIDENGAQVPLSEIDLIILTVEKPGATNTAASTVLRQVECLNSNNVTVAEGSTVTTMDWEYQVQDTYIVDRTKRTEVHNATFEFGHNSASNGSVTDKISTTSSSSLVTIAIAGHGLTVGSTGHHVFLNATDAVDGITLKGAYRITSVVDSTDLVIESNCDATGTTSSSGGVMTWWLNGKSNKHVVRLAVKRNEPVCA